MKRFAIFFPQFQTAQVNDAAWGYGFTDWSLVANANAFDLWQRRAPASGFYDLSKSEQIARHFEQAASAGIDGFGLYHYMFEDGPELASVEQYLSKSAVPEGFKYFFIWANESWSKRWAGKDTEILKVVTKKPSAEQVTAHVAYLRPFLASSDYARVDGRPLFLLYRADFFEDSSNTLRMYRQAFERAGLNPLIGFCIKNAADREYCELFDFCYLFEPRLFFNFYGLKRNPALAWLYKRLSKVLPYSVIEKLSKSVNNFVRSGKSKTYAFAQYLSYFSSSERAEFVASLNCPAQDILVSGWNNAPRYRADFTEVETPTGKEFESLVSRALTNQPRNLDLPLLCNAWNEWSEGAAIEPCKYLGDRLLKTYVGATSGAPT